MRIYFKELFSSHLYFHQMLIGYPFIVHFFLKVLWLLRSWKLNKSLDIFFFKNDNFFYHSEFLEVLINTVNCNRTLGFKECNQNNFTLEIGLWWIQINFFEFFLFSINFFEWVQSELIIKRDFYFLGVVLRIPLLKARDFGCEFF